MTGPCARPECGGTTHTDGWGNPIQCPRDDSVLYFDGPAEEFTLAPPVAPRIVIYGEDNRTPLVTINPNGKLEYGPGYTPDEAARRFWDALRHHMPARCPNCGHIDLEAHHEG
ncbi:hypothetical protein [Streptomyces sp. NRRL S-1022]|uniref:hypothetical protein n=1 Tax=Streptomyces sp. NRRL S-1022 TaxID=1463880 RepID=UPI0004C1E8AE|nr:hypothetical protein [Streptomyces sp. NRRL S-1022]